MQRFLLRRVFLLLCIELLLSEIVVCLLSKLLLFCLHFLLLVWRHISVIFLCLICELLIFHLLEEIVCCCDLYKSYSDYFVQLSFSVSGWYCLASYRYFVLTYCWVVGSLRLSSFKFYETRLKPYLHMYRNIIGQKDFIKTLSEICFLFHFLIQRLKISIKSMEFIKICLILLNFVQFY